MNPNMPVDKQDADEIAPEKDALAGGTKLSTLKKIERLRAKIKARSLELNIQPDHDETGHWYGFNGKKYPSVTGRLKILKDEALFNWKMNIAVNSIQSKWKPNQAYSQDLIDAIITEAKALPTITFESAGDVGRQVHDWREIWFQRLIDDNPIVTGFDNKEGDDGAVISARRGLKKFMSDTQYQPLATELYVADPKLGIGGTLDDIGLLNDKLVLIDLKTSNIGDKESYYAQVCLYLAMFKKLYRLYPKGVYILHLSKENGTYDLIPLHERCNIAKTTRWAKQVVKVSQGLEELRESKKKKGVEYVPRTGPGDSILGT